MGETLKSTPGPWVLEYLGSNGAFSIATTKDFGDEDYFVIASRSAFSHNAEESCANAHLIAAAPLLYRELLHLVRLLEPVLVTANIPGLATLNGAHAALAQAEGRGEG